MKNTFSQSWYLLMVIIFVAGCSSRSPVTSGIGTSAIHNTNEFSRYLKTDNPKWLICYQSPKCNLA